MQPWYLIKFKEFKFFTIKKLFLLKLLSVGSLFILIAVAYEWFCLYHKVNINNITISNNSYILEVAPKQSFRSLIYKLKKDQLISNTTSYGLYIWAKCFGYDKQIKAGEYLITDKIKPIEIIKKIVAGQVILHKFTIIEGSRLEQLLSSLHNNIFLEHTMLGSVNNCKDLLRSINRSLDAKWQNINFIENEINQDFTPCEGLFMPETYFFAKSTKDILILQRSYDAMQEKLYNLWSNSPKTILKSPYEVLIMASIIEKETSLLPEMPRVSGVYHHRLNINMPLQADPTVTYGAKIFDRSLTRKDLKINSKYNTYCNKGLPPGPIAIPSIEAIIAALHPVKDDALYFVADGSGGHVFSSSLSEHNKAVLQAKSRKQGEF